MTLRELLDRDRLFVRRRDWPHLNDHIELVRSEQGEYASIAISRRTVGGALVESRVFIDSFLDTDGWEPWELRK